MKGLQLRYFVLKPKGIGQHAEASRKGMLAYADVIEEIEPELAYDLRKWVETEGLEAAATRKRYDV